MSFYDYSVLSTSWINQPELGKKPARTLLVGAALLNVRQRFGDYTFDVDAHSTAITDNPADTMLWLAQWLTVPARLLLWRAEDIVVPSLIATADTARDITVAAQLLRRLDQAFRSEVIDVALSHGGSAAESFDQIAHQHGISFVSLPKKELAEAHLTGCHMDVRRHLIARAIGTWRLWLAGQSDVEELVAATAAWIAERDQPAKPKKVSI